MWTGCLWLGVETLTAQPLHRTGQSIQPVYEGWNKNEDGTLSMWFGYLNRNYVEQPHVVIGADNDFEPGASDRGQPTHFYPRRQHFVFQVRLPADWGDKDLVWTLTHHGQTYTAIGSLWDSWLLDEGVWQVNRGGGLRGRYGKEALVNQSPSVEIVGASKLTAMRGQVIPLEALARDDGLPGPKTSSSRPPYEPLPNDLPTIGGRRSGAASGVGGPTDQNMIKGGAANTTGLAITWIHYRGPGTVRFDPPVTSVSLPSGHANTLATFTESGTYVIKAAADDGSYVSMAPVTVVVN